MLPLVITAQAFGRVFDQFNVILFAKIGCFVYTAGMAKSVHGHNRGYAPSGLYIVRPRLRVLALPLFNPDVLFEPGSQSCRRKPHRIAVYIDKHRMGSAIGNGIDGGHKSQWLSDHLFVAFQPGQMQSQMQRIGSVDANHRFGRSGKAGHFFFETVDKPAHTRHIGGVDAFPEVFFFVPSKHRCMQRYRPPGLPECLPDKLQRFGKKLVF